MLYPLELNDCTCKICNKPFYKYMKSRKDPYPFCSKHDNELIEKVKKFLNENKGASKFDVCEAEVVTDKILQMFIRDERLTEYADTLYPGECTCGEKLEPGHRYCKKCMTRYKLQNEGENNSLRNERIDQSLNSNGFHSSFNKKR